MKLSRNYIKWIAILTMFCDHATKLLVSRKTLGYIIGRNVIGRIAFPLFGMLLVEGFFKTKNRKQHILKLLILAIISEPLYDLILHHGWDKQSIIVTWLLGYLLLYLLALIEQSVKLQNLHLQLEVKLLLVLGFGQLSYLLKVDYSWAAILAIYGAYEIYRSPKISTYWKAVLSTGLFGLLEGILFNSWGALLAILPVLAYDSSKNLPTNKIYKQLLYWSYPIHLVILKVVCLLLMKNGV